MTGLNTEIELQHVCTRISVGLAMAVTPYISETGVTLIRNQNIKPNKFDDSSIVYVKHGFAASQTAKRVRGGDVVIVRTGANIGDACVVPEAFDGAQSFTTLIVSTDQRRLCPDYLAQFINSSFGRSEVERLMAGGGKGNLNSGVLRRFRIKLLPIHEQEHVAAVLSDWDTAIQKTEQLIAANERQRAAVIARLYALSDRNGTSLRFGGLLRESTEVGTSGRYARKLTVKLYGNGIVAKGEKRQGSDQTQYFVRRAGQLVYSKLDFLNGAFGIIPPELDGYESTLDLPAFDVAPTVNPVWLLGYLTRPTYYTRQVGLARGQRKARRVHPSDLLVSSIRVPPRKLQDQIASVLTASQREIALTQDLVDSFQAQKCGLMQKLLTGEWRLPSKEQEAV
jgi:type I restriction enzyme S subunit